MMAARHLCKVFADWQATPTATPSNPSTTEATSKDPHTMHTLNILGKSFEELAALFFCEIADDDDFYDVLAYNLATEHRKPLEALLGSLSGKRLRAAIGGLGWTGSSQSDGLIGEYLSHTDPLIAATALDALCHTGSVEWVMVSHHLQHSSEYVRGAALRFAKARLGAQALPILRKALQDPAAIVRENALDALDGIVAANDLHWIAPYLSDPATNVRQAAAGVVEAMT